MRYKNGSPKTIYTVTSQVDGEIVPFTSVDARKKFLAQMGGDLPDSQVALGTYDLREKK